MSVITLNPKQTEQKQPTSPSNTGTDVQIYHARTGSSIAEVKELLAEYSHWLAGEFGKRGYDAEQVLDSLDYDDGLTDLFATFAPPTGRLFLAKVDGRAAGCVALRKFDEGICELRMMYVRPAYRRLGIARVLIELAIHEARKIGYQRMYLETARFMQPAHVLYYAAGFKTILPYQTVPRELRTFVIALGLDLDQRREGE